MTFINFTMSEVFLGIGLIGVCLQIVSYSLLQAGYIKGDGYTYVVMNLIAAVLILVSLTDNLNIPAALKQIIWILISVGGMARIYYLSSRARFTDEERRLLDLKFPRLRRISSEKIVKAGHWVDGTEGALLSEEGEILGRLIFLMQGRAFVLSSDKVVGTCGPGSMIGELTVLEGGPASATVKLTENSRYFYIERDDLLSLCERNDDIRDALFGSIQKELGDKLRQQNATSAGVSSG